MGRVIACALALLVACGPDTSMRDDNCGNGIRETGEECDGDQLADTTCEDRGFAAGTLACTAMCRFDESACTSDACGDNTVNGTEQCDGADLGNQSCVTQGFDAGQLACLTSCTFDTSACTTCGDNMAAGVEVCDGTDLDGATCASLGFTAGTPSCTSGCSFDTSACTTCGDGTAEGTEQCDMTDHASQTCVTRGFTAGTLACSSSCMFDESACTECGNNTQETGEQCDMSDLDGQMCSTQGFTAGTLACTSSCAFDTSACTLCGDNMAEGAEDCDGPDLKSQTCALQGFTTGTLACANNCMFDTSACTTCGNSMLETGEQCEGTNLDNKTCITQGFASGELGCTACAFNTSLCSNLPAPSSGGLVITEIMQNPSGTDTTTGEWIELYNPSPTVTYELRGCVVSDGNTETFTINAALSIAPQSYITLSNVANPGFTPSYVYGIAWVLNNAIDTVRITCENGMVDEVTYDDGATFPDPDGASMSLRVGLDATDNNTGTNWCTATTPLGSQFGTPNAQNSCPPIYTVGNCRVEFPLTINQTAGSTAQVFGRVFIAGVTDVSGTNDTPPTGFSAQLGIGPDGTDPATNGAWTWTTATANAGYNVGSPNYEATYDEYQRTLAVPAITGPYDYAFRFRAQTGQAYVYCDTNGGAYAAADAGQLTSTTLNVWINEIHYENTGTDADEGVEIAGLAGTTLTGFSIVEYNGATFGTSGTTALTGTIPDQGNGYGTVWVPIAGLQNDLEGLALVTANGVMQFLCYEGTFTASGGPATGMTCTDIGVAEASGTPVGQSLQLIGTGNMYSSFTWAVPATHSRGTVNAGQLLQ